MFEDLKEILDLTSDPIIFETFIMFVCNVSLTFIIKRLINTIHKMFSKHSIINGFHTHHFSIVFTHGVRMGGWATRKSFLYLRNHKVYEVETW